MCISGAQNPDLIQCKQLKKKTNEKNALKAEAALVQD